MSLPPPTLRSPAPARWRLETLDGARSYTLMRNPNAAASPFATRDITWNNNRGQFTGTRAPRTPVRWQFSGVLHDQADYDALLAWRRKIRGGAIGRCRRLRLLGEGHR